jgi:hypothetical protein
MLQIWNPVQKIQVTSDRKFWRAKEYKFIGSVNGRKVALPPEVEDELAARILKPEECFLDYNCRSQEDIELYPLCHLT